MIINMAKTKELVFRSPNPRLTLDVCVITGVERVCEAKLLGLIFKDNLKIDSHISYVLKLCSQRLYLLKQLLTKAFLVNSWILSFSLLL